MGITTISWTHYTFNPWEGCQAISPACDHCYARRRDIRLHRGRHWEDEHLLHDSHQYWKQLWQWNAAAAAAGEIRRVFVGSLMDVFEKPQSFVLNRERQRLWQQIPHLKWLDFLLTTKRPENARQCLPAEWNNSASAPGRMPSNVRCMVTVESQEYTGRIAAAAAVFPRVGVSAEPLLGPLDLGPAIARRQLDWVITGGESGPAARITELAWVRSLRDQAQAAGIAFHFKQWGEWAPFQDEAKPHALRASRPGGANYYRIGAGHSGRILDARTYLEFPPDRPLPEGATPPAAAAIFFPIIQTA